MSWLLFWGLVVGKTCSLISHVFSESVASAGMAGSSEESPSASAPSAEESADAAAEANSDSTAAVQEVKQEVAEKQDQEMAKEEKKEAVKEPEKEVVVAKEAEPSFHKTQDDIPEHGAAFKMPASRVEAVFLPAVLEAASPDTMKEEHRQLALDRREVRLVVFRESLR